VSKLPTQLKWAQFVAALTNLQYKQLKSKGGSARHFQRLSDGAILTFHEPHGGDTLRQGTLTEYLRHMDVSREEFIQALEGRTSLAAASEEERFKRVLDSDGTIISNCNECFARVMRSKIEEEVAAAEAGHPCYLNKDA